MPRGTSIYDEANLQERLWQPTNDTTCCGWWDAFDTSTMAFGTGISSWSSKAGAPNAITQATGTAQPTYDPNYRNGRPYAVFNNANTQNLSITSPVGLPTNKNAVTMATVCYHNSLSTAYAWVGGLGSALTTGGARGFIKIGNTGFSDFDLQNASNQSNINVNNIDGIWTGAMPTTAGTTVVTKHTFNGVSFTSGSVTIVNVSSVFMIGNVNSSGSPMSGGVGEFLIFNDNFSAYRLNILEGYLAWKWGLVEKLPGSHPFKNRPPLIGD